MKMDIMLSKWIGVGKARLQPFELPDETSYRSYGDGLAQSTVKHVLDGVRKYRKQTDLDISYSPGLAIGNVVDSLLTDPTKLHNLNVIPDKPPTGLLGKAVAYMLKGYSLEEAYEYCGFKQDSIEVVRDKIDSCKYYWTMMSMVHDSSKIHIMQRDYETALSVHRSLISHPHTSKYCRLSYGPGMEIKSQMAIVYEYKPVWYKKERYVLKGLLDRVIVNHKKMCVQPIDFKTTQHATTNFRKPFNQFKYDIQAYWYTQACKAFFKGYKVLPFLFVVESTTNQGCPLVYEVDKKTMKEAKKKVHKALHLYDWYSKNGFEYEIEIVKNSGRLKI